MGSLNDAGDRVRHHARCARKPRPVGLDGAFRWSGSVAVLLTAAGPDEGEALAVILDEVGVDWNGEARIVELDREVVAALVGALRPGGPDLCAADIDSMGGGGFADPIGIGDDAETLRLVTQGDSLALEL